MNSLIYKALIGCIAAIAAAFAWFLNLDNLPRVHLFVFFMVMFAAGYAMRSAKDETK